ncbi:MAG: Peptidase sortase-like protein [Parcubacteria group bacterium]|nr:Peptidase sortase-like protein [Parcubacteria group bacterium]
MEKLIHAIAGLILATRKAATRKWSFVGLFILAFFVSTAVLAHMDLLPNPPSTPVAVAETSIEKPIATSTPVATPELPLRIEIPKIKLATSISNPTTTKIAILDQYLLKGAVRYPTSAELGEKGNVVLFGHSSYLPIVRNQAYKAFNDIQKLKAGDTVMVYSATTAYTYRVRSVLKESATDAGIPLDVSGQVLTLSTCDSFGEKADRFVLTADFIESHPSSN